MDAGARTIVLVGPRGAGKSTLARTLGARLDVPAHDLDADVIAGANASIATIFAQHGEARFRARESAALRARLAEPPHVLATGGGVVLAPLNREVLSASRAIIVYLCVDASTALARVPSAATDRPALTHQAWPDELAALIVERDPLYRAVADLVLDATVTPDALLDALLGALPTGP